MADSVRFGPKLAAVAMLFSYTHLALDWLTFWGVPLLYPWSVARFTAGVFFYSVTLMVPFSAYLVWRVSRGTATGRGLRIPAILLVAALVVAGGVRAATYPRHTGAEVVHPSAGEWSWTTMDRVLLPDGAETWEMRFYSFGREVGNSSYASRLPPESDADARWALDQARASLLYREFELYAGGPTLVQVTTREDGGHNVTFIDLMERAQADRVPWVPFADEAGYLELAVVQGEVIERDP